MSVLPPVLVAFLFRFKVREEEPTGLLTGLCIKIHWALPYRGQSKPIERAAKYQIALPVIEPAVEAGQRTGVIPLGHGGLPFRDFIGRVAQSRKPRSSWP